MNHPGPSVRPAVAEDAYALWLWANDAGSREASAGRELIPWATHVAWLSHRLTDASACLLVAEIAGGQPIGTIRFETEDGWRSARLSYALAPESRGRRFGQWLVAAGVAFVLGQHPHTRVYAVVYTSNERSLRVFRGLGWTEQQALAEALFWAPVEGGE